MLNPFKPQLYTEAIDKLRDRTAFAFSEYVYNILSIERIRLNTILETTVVVFKDDKRVEMYYDLSRDQHEWFIKAYHEGTKKGSKVMYYISTNTPIDSPQNCECHKEQSLEELADIIPAQEN